MADLAIHYAFDWWIETLGENRQVTIDTYWVAVQRLWTVGTFEKVGDLTNVQKWHLFFKRLDKKFAPVTKRYCVQQVQRLTQFLFDMGVITGPNPFKVYPNFGHFELPQVIEDKQVLSREEVAAIVAHGHKDPKTIWITDQFMFLYYTGRRYQTMRNMMRQDVDIEAGKMFYRHEKALDGRDLSRHVFLKGQVGEEIKGILARALDRHPYSGKLWRPREFKPYPMQSQTMGDYFRRYLFNPLQITVKDGPVHLLRRTSITHQLEGGRTKESIKFWSGLSEDTIDKYDKRLMEEERSSPDRF